MAAKSQATSRSRSDTMFDDAPVKPPILTLTLRSRKKTLWQQFQETIASLSPQEIMTQLTATRNAIKAKLEKGEKITDEDIEFLNKTMEEQVTKILDDFKERAIKTTKITSSDSSEEVKLKLEVQEGL